MNTSVATTGQKRELITVFDPTPMFDTAAFDHMYRIALRMARASLLPQHLQVFRDAAGQIVKPGSGEFDLEGTVGNCLAVINTARAWRMDPMAVAECMSMVNGKRCYEGKMVAAAIETNLGIELKYEWSGDPNTDAFTIKVSHPDEPEKFVSGDVAGWKTQQWGANRKEFRKRLKYRGDREWCRMWAPALMLGVYSDDEMDELRADAAARRASPVGPGLGDRFNGPSQDARGFSLEHVNRETGAETIDPKTGEITETGKPAPETQPVASGKEPATASNPGGADAVATETTKDIGSNKPEAEKVDTAAQAEGNVETTGGVTGAASSPGAPKDSNPPAGDAADRSGEALNSRGEPDDGEAGAGEAGAASPSIRIDAALVKGYSKALERAEQIRSISKFKEQFFKGKPATQYDEQSREWLKAVADFHKRRIAGEFDIAAVDRKIAELVKEIEASAGSAQ